jgi:hypothetical protein
MMAGRMAPIPPSIVGTVAPILADAYTHSALNSLFMANGFPGDPPEGNKSDKCLNWSRRANNESADPLAMLASLIAEFMDGDACQPNNY